MTHLGMIRSHPRRGKRQFTWNCLVKGSQTISNIKNKSIKTIKMSENADESENTIEAMDNAIKNFEENLSVETEYV